MFLLEHRIVDGESRWIKTFYKDMPIPLTDDTEIVVVRKDGIEMTMTVDCAVTLCAAIDGMFDENPSGSLMSCERLVAHPGEP